MKLWVEPVSNTATRQRPCIMTWSCIIFSERGKMLVSAWMDIVGSPIFFYRHPFVWLVEHLNYKHMFTYDFVPLGEKFVAMEAPAIFVAIRDLYRRESLGRGRLGDGSHR
jgi:hypothetical protein